MLVTRDLHSPSSHVRTYREFFPSLSAWRRDVAPRQVLLSALKAIRFRNQQLTTPSVTDLLEVKKQPYNYRQRTLSRPAGGLWRPFFLTYRSLKTWRGDGIGYGDVTSKNVSFTHSSLFSLYTTKPCSCSCLEADTFHNSTSGDDHSGSYPVD